MEGKGREERARERREGEARGGEKRGPHLALVWGPRMLNPVPPLVVYL